MKETVKQAVVRIAFAASVSIFCLALAVGEVRSGAPPTEWLPEIIFAALFPAALFVDAVAIWTRSGRRSEARSDTWDRLRLGCYGAWSLVGVGFLGLGNSEPVVLVLTVAGVIGTATALSHHYRSSKSADT